MLIYYLFVGIVAGITVASWNSFKDSPWENFHPYRFPRSSIVGIVVSILLLFAEQKKLLTFDNFGLLFLTIITFERLSGEIIKGFLKKDFHLEFISAFKLYCVPYQDYGKRFIVGIILFGLGLTSLILLGIGANHLPSLISNKLILWIIYGFIGGLISAIAGAWKDAPFEGFKFYKFLKSPLVGIFGAFILQSYTSFSAVFLYSIIGFERLTVEFYKTFLTRKIRGIFKEQKAKYPEWFGKRKIFFGSYIFGVCIFVILLLYT